MSEEKKPELIVKVNGVGEEIGCGVAILAIVLLVIAFAGELDLVDALIYFLMK